MLRGRRAECGVLDGLLEGVRSGRGAVLVVRGEAGVGKTALLDYTVRSAPDLRSVRTAGVESEMDLAFAGLHRLCGPMLDWLGRLPGPQRDALRIAFGLEAGAAPNRFLVGLAVLSLLSEVAGDRPLVCVVDDVQWLDRASVQVLAFAARRLLAEAVLVLFAGREQPGGDLDGLPELMVEGLCHADARKLLGSVVRWPLDERVADRIVAETRGNPLALLELPCLRSPAELAGGFGLPEVVRLPGRIRENFLGRVESLPEQTRLLLAVAAADPTGDPALVRRAAGHLGLGIDVTEQAEETGLLDIAGVGGRVVFRHPLIRSAAYGAVSRGDRRRVHAALAEVTDTQADPDRRAWHLAQATSGPDEQVAAELERSAGRAQARGGMAAAAAFLERSVVLTAEPGRRAERTLAAAQASLHAGAFDKALALLVGAEDGPLDEFSSARMDVLRGQIAFSSGLGSDASPLLFKAARRLESLNLEMAREAYMSAWMAALLAGRFAGAGDLAEVSQAARALPRPARPPGLTDLVLDGLALLVTEGPAVAAPALQRAAGAFASADISEERLRLGWLGQAAASALWDEGRWRAILVRQAQLARNAGALDQLPVDLSFLATDAAWRGDFTAAAALIAETVAVCAATGARTAPFAAMLMASLRGDHAEAAPLIEATIAEAAARGQGLAATYAHWAAAILNNGLGRYHKALAAAQCASQETPALYMSMWALPELIEAATRCANSQLAAEALERLAETTRPGGTDFGLGIEARSRALLSEGAAAEGLYREAIDRIGRTQLRPELGRAHLLYGEWLRREGRRTDAREQLREAYEMLTVMGVKGFAGRARCELLATGENVRKRRVEATGDLTAQEAQIARLARDGLSNLEISTQLFLSPRTIEWHLRKVFAKLEISSRKQLKGALLTPDGRRQRRPGTAEPVR